MYGVPPRVLAKACEAASNDAGGESGDQFAPTVNMPVDSVALPANELPSLVGRQPVAPPPMPPQTQPDAPHYQPEHPHTDPAEVHRRHGQEETPWRYRGVLTPDEPTAQPALSGMDTDTAFRPIGDPNVFASSGPRQFRPQEPPPRRPNPQHLGPHRPAAGHPSLGRGRFPQAQRTPHPAWPPAR